MVALEQQGWLGHVELGQQPAVLGTDGHQDLARPATPAYLADSDIVPTAGLMQTRWLPVWQPPSHPLVLSAS